MQEKCERTKKEKQRTSVNINFNHNVAVIPGSELITDQVKFA